ncbi:unnamed protein product [Rotaria magnacalcarata]|uniref:MYND-type domain-containing protein n=3 Tax=Rotaria magnacalcarata TaxID=392030 RepID=A0A816LMH5_9BILA|nr:unnamed protein product [Rotaria magnacalcarata]
MTDSQALNWFKIELLLTRACLILRKIFKDRWFLFTGQQWQNTTTDGQAFITGIGQNIYKNCGNIQKIMLTTGDTNQWDLTTLVLVLRETKPIRPLNKMKKQKIAKENIDLLRLTNIRNNNAHHASKCISDAEFEIIWSQLTPILISFGDDADEIEALKLNTNDTKQKESINNESTDEAKRLKDLGNEAYKQKHFDEALKWFSQALVLAGLSDFDRSILYSNRAATYLEKPEPTEFNSSNNSRYLALQDAEHARDLRPTWPKAHCRVGQAYMALGEFEKAVHSYNKALALDPTNIEMQNTRDFALERKHYYGRQEHLDIRSIPRTTREQLTELSKTTGLTTEQQEKVIDMIRKHDPGKDAVFTGPQYRDGDDNVKQNYELAAKFYSKAVALGSAEGMYNLALLHQRGLGVQIDMQTSIRLLEQAAAQNPTMSDKCPIPNVGVAEAEHSLGLHYEMGVGVEMNYHKASQWYQRASDHGSSTAANNLGLMYEEGRGVSKDLVKSEHLLRLSAVRGDPNAMMNLALLLFKKNDLQDAERWCQRASDNNNMLAKECLKTYQKAAEKEREHFKELNVEKWEKENGLATSTLAYNERIKRKVLADEPSVAKAYSVVYDLTKAIQSLKPVPQPMGAKRREFNYAVLKQYSLKGSIFAKRLLEAQIHFFRTIEILTKDDIADNERDAQFVKELSTSIRIEHIVIQLPEVLHKEAKLAVDRLLIRCNAKESELDENARVCYGYLHMNSLESTIEFLTVCIQMYPKSHFFLELRGSLYGFLGKFDQGLADVNAALQLVPNDVMLLYDRAAMLRLVKHVDLNETIAAYKKFLEYSPIDHRKVPEAYYAVASCYFVDNALENNFQLSEEYYDKGIEAEKKQLPFFLPYESNNKLFISKLISLKPKNIDRLPLTEPVIDTQKPKSRLTDPRRTDMIYSHRESFVRNRKIFSGKNIITHTVKPRLHQNSPASFIGLKGITLREMNPLKDHVYQGFVLSGIIFEQSPIVEPSIWLLIEDENGDLERLFIYNTPPSEGWQLIKHTYTYGAKLSILNPYMRMTADQKPAIRIDDVSSIILHGDTHNVKDMCRCCGQANASRVCGKCKSAHYCSKECQTLDWKQYGHKLICS